MTELAETATTLRFFGNDLDPDAVTAALGALKEGNEWINLKPETSLMVGQRGLVLNFDIYSGQDEPDEDDY